MPCRMGHALGFQGLSGAAVRHNQRDTCKPLYYGWAKSIYFKDPDGLSLEYCCLVRNLTKDDATMQARFTIPRDALELGNATGAKVFKAQLVRNKRWPKRHSPRALCRRSR